MVKIVAAAINYGAIISLPPPARHHTIIQSMDLVMGIDGTKATPETQGFITDEGQFVNRVEAYYIALRSAQLIKVGAVPELYSEDLW